LSRIPVDQFHETRVRRELIVDGGFDIKVTVAVCPSMAAAMVIQ
jgi:hypothetical protein